MNHRIVLLTTASLMLTAPIASATNGYFTHATGTKSKGMAGAGLAMPQEAISIANNPAAALQTSGRLDISAALFSPVRSYSTSASLANGNGGAFTIGPDTISSEKEYFVIPGIAYNWALGLDSAIGAAFYGRGGMNTTWQGGSATFDPDGPGPAPVMTQSGTFGSGPTGVDLSQAFLDVTYARQVNDSFSFGAALVLAVQTFEAKGLGSFAGYTESFGASGSTEMPANLTNNGHDLKLGVGAKLGLQANLSSTLSVAASYQSRIAMDEFDSYANLFAGQGGFDIPASARLGLTWRANDAIAIHLDFEHVWFSDIAAVGNPVANLFACPTAGAGGTDLSSCLGGDNGAGFGWDDVTVAKAGVEWNTNRNWTWRAGISHAEQPIASSEVLFNILSPAVIEDHFSVGFTRKNGRKSEFSFALTYMPEGEVSGVNPLDPTQTISLKMHQWDIEFSYSFQF